MPSWFPGPVGEAGAGRRLPILPRGSSPGPAGATPIPPQSTLSAGSATSPFHRPGNRGAEGGGQVGLDAHLPDLLAGTRGPGLLTPVGSCSRTGRLQGLQGLQGPSDLLGPPGCETQSRARGENTGPSSPAAPHPWDPAASPPTAPHPPPQTGSHRTHERAGSPEPHHVVWGTWVWGMCPPQPPTLGPPAAWGPWAGTPGAR